MAPSAFDFSDDFSAPAAAAARPSVADGTKRSLLLAPPSVAAHEEKLRSVFTTFDRSTSDLQMLDRLSAGLVSLPSATYDLVLVLADSNDRQTEALQLLSRQVFDALVPSMKPQAVLQLQHGRFGAAEAREAILAGLVEQDGAFVKEEEEEAVIPLRLGANKKKDQMQTTSSLLNGVVMVNPDDDLGEYEDGDELIDEDDLLSEEDLKRPPQQRKSTHKSTHTTYFSYANLAFSSRVCP